MTDKKEKLVKLATERFGTIFPCGQKELEDSFTEDAGYLIFWFNDRENSTHIVSEHDTEIG